MGVLGLLLARIMAVPATYSAYGSIRDERRYGEREFPGTAFLERLLVRGAAVITVPAPRLAHDLERRYPGAGAKIHVIPLGASDEICVERAAKESPKESPGSGESPIVAYVGRCVPIKGIDLLLAALKDQEVRVKIAGRSSRFFDRLKKQYASQFVSGQFAYLGVLDEPSLHRLYRDADILAVPSRFDTFGLNAVEGMLYGLPVVVTTGGGIHEFLREGEDALIVPPDDPQALREAVVRLAKDPALRARIGEAARRKARKMTWEKTAEGFLEVLQSVS